MFSIVPEDLDRQIGREMSEEDGDVPRKRLGSDEPLRRGSAALAFFFPMRFGGRSIACRLISGPRGAVTVDG